MAADSKFQHSTLEYRLQRAGYRTAIYGKFLNGWDLALPPPPYFDDAAIMSGPYSPMHANVRGEQTRISEYWTRYVQQRAVQFLREQMHGTRPWFLYLALRAPHAPYTPERKYADAPVPSWQGDRGLHEADLTDKLHMQPAELGIVEANSSAL
jgi:Sulfatase